MKKFYLLFLLQSLLLIPGKGQNPNWQWAKSGGCDGGEGIAACTDIDGYIYAIGSYWGCLSFGNVVLQDSTGIYLVKYNKAGNLIWAKSYTAIGVDASEFAIAADNKGSVFIFGRCDDSIAIIRNDTLVNVTGWNRQQHIFLMKIDSLGNILWVQCAAGVYYGDAMAVACDKNGNAIVTGDFADSIIKFGPYTLLNNAPNFNNNIYIAKYDSTGKVAWAITAQGLKDTCHALGVDIATDAIGNIYVSGYFVTDTLIFGADTITKPLNSGNFFLIKLDPLGKLVWAKYILKGKYISGTGVTTDSAGHIIVVGLFDGKSAICGSDTLINAGSTGQGFFLLKYANNGNLIWAKTPSANTTSSRITGISANPDGNFYMIGDLDGSNPYITFDSIAINPVAGYDPIYIIKFDTNGMAVCGQALSSGGDDANCIVADNFGNAVITGDYAYGPIIFGKDTLPSANIEFVFVAQFNCGTQSCNINPPVITGDTNINIICSSDSVHLCGPPGFAAYNWSDDYNGQCIYISQTGNYTLTVVDNANCTTASIPFYLNVLPKQQNNVYAKGDTLTGYSYGNVSYQWYFDNTPINGATAQAYVALTPGTYRLAMTDVNGCVVFSTPVIITDISNDELAEQIEIYPNPLVTGNWNLKLSPGMLGSNVEIFDATGRLVHSFKVSSLNQQIDFNAAQGVYVLYLHSGSNNYEINLIRL